VGFWGYVAAGALGGVPGLLLEGQTGYFSNLFSGTDNAIVEEAMKFTPAIIAGNGQHLADAAVMTEDHGQRQAKFAQDAEQLNTLLKSGWEGDASEAAQRKVKNLGNAAEKTGESLSTNAQSLHAQTDGFNHIYTNIRPLPDPPPTAGFGSRLAPWDTGSEKAVKRAHADAKHNIELYKQYGQTSSSNANNFREHFGTTGAGPGGGPGPGNPNEPIDTGEADRRKREEEARRKQQEAERQAAEQRRKMEEEARRRQQEAEKRAEEQRRKMEEEARKRQEEAERRAAEQKKKMEEEARRRQQEAEKRAEEQRKRMEEEARRRQQEAEERARQAREAMRRSGSSFTPGSTSASSFSPSDFAGAGSGGGASGCGASGAGGVGAGAGTGDASGAAGAGKASGAMAPGAGAGAGGAGAGGARGGAGGARGMGGMGGMMGGAGGGGKGGEDKEHKRKVMATEDPNDLFGTDEKSVPPVIGDK